MVVKDPQLMPMRSKYMPIKPHLLFSRPLRERLRIYQKRLAAIDAHLCSHPHDWGKFQVEFNENINYVFSEIMWYAENNPEARVSRLRALFNSQYGEIFRRGQLNSWSRGKPFGYAGDFWIIDQIYRNQPTSAGLDRLFDNYFQMTAISVAVRNRKNDFKQIILDYVLANPGKKIKILDVASGPAREIYELANDPAMRGADVEFHLFDQDQRGLDYAADLLTGAPFRLKFIQGNVMRLSVVKDPHKVLEDKYDLVYSTGLFDYLNGRITVRLIRNLYSLLKPGGLLAVSDVREKHKNPTVYYMEWVVDWNLLYNDDDEFRSHCLEAGIDRDRITFLYEQQGILQYFVARA